MKIMGKREIGELDVSELVSTLLISEIAAIPIDDPDLPLMNAIIPIIFILSLEILFSYGKTKFRLLKKVMEGKPVYLIYKGRIDQRALRENRITINELISEVRIQGVGDIGEVRYAILEQSGKISIQKQGDGCMGHTLIIDGEFNGDELSAAGLTKKNVLGELQRRNTKIEDVFLMTVNDGKYISIIEKDKE